jgi:hypothetical protein
MERLLSRALAQAMGAWQSERIIAERAKRGSREKFLAVLAKTPDAPPVAAAYLRLRGLGRRFSL